MLAVYEILSYVDPKAVSFQLHTVCLSSPLWSQEDKPPQLAASRHLQYMGNSCPSTQKSVYHAENHSAFCHSLHGLSLPRQPLPTSQAPAGGSPFKTCPESQGRCTRVLPSTWHWPDDRLLNSGHCALINVLQPPRHAVVGSHGTRSQLKHPDLSHTYAIGVFHSVSHSTNIAFKKIISTPKADTFP